MKSGSIFFFVLILLLSIYSVQSAKTILSERGKNWYSVDAGEKKQWNISNFDITYVEFRIARHTLYPEVKITLLNISSGDIEAENAILYFNVSYKNMLVNSTTFEFMVNSTYAKNKEMVLSVFTSEWIDLKTNKSRNDSEYAYYRATATNVTKFAVRIKNILEEIPIIKEQEPIGTQIQPEATTQESPPEKPEEKPQKRSSLYVYFIIVGIAIVMISYWMKSYKRYVKKMKERIEQRQEQDEINRLKKEKEQIGKIFKEYNNLPTPKYQKGKPEYGNEQQIIDYFNNLRQKSKVDAEIIQSLIDAGWNENLVHRIYKKYQNSQ
jgi:hypothetical protein